MGNKLFGMPLTNPPKYLSRAEKILTLFSFILHFILPFYLLSFYRAWFCIMALSFGFLNFKFKVKVFHILCVSVKSTLII
jgi:hypothetical protein